MQFIIETYSSCFQKIEISEYLISSFQYMYSTVEDRAAPLKFMTLIVLMQSKQTFVFCYLKSVRAEAGSTKFVVKWCLERKQQSNYFRLALSTFLAIQYIQKVGYKQRKSLTCVLVSGFKHYYDEEITHVYTLFE